MAKISASEIPNSFSARKFWILQNRAFLGEATTFKSNSTGLLEDYEMLLKEKS